MRSARDQLGRARRLIADRRGRQRERHDLQGLSSEDLRYLKTLWDDTVPLPPGAEEVLRPDNPELVDLRARYRALDDASLSASRWNAEAIRSFLDLRYFRGETLITWHYRESRRISELKYFVLMRYVQERDPGRLLEALDEDGAFGCWTFDFPGDGRVSRDLLESVNELAFLERALRLSALERFSVLDIGAGYGRLAHRMTAAYPRLHDYCCVDAVPESTFLSDYYLGYRGAKPRARSVALDRLDAELEPGAFDLAVNVHSFSECTHDAVAWWMERLERLRVPRLMIVPNDGSALLSLEPDGSRRNVLPLVEATGYRLEHSEPVIDDPAVRALAGIDDRFLLFARDL